MRRPPQRYPNYGYRPGYRPGYAVPRPYGRYYGPGYGYRYPRYGYYGGYYRGYGYYGYPWYGAGYSPYYWFSPRWSIGFGLSVGYPVAWYGASYGYPVPYTYGAYPNYYPSPSGTTVVINPSTTGGVAFEIEPQDAEIYVDGNYMGTTGEYSATSRPLPLPPGRHRIELRAQGYQSVSVDVDVVPGQVIPYRGALEPY